MKVESIVFVSNFLALKSHSNFLISSLENSLVESTAKTTLNSSLKKEPLMEIVKSKFQKYKKKRRMN